MLKYSQFLFLFITFAAGCVAIAPDEASADLKAKAHTYAGHCQAGFKVPAKTGWNHSVAATLATAAGAPNHRIRDLILPVGKAGQLRGRFTYGKLDKDLEDENVELWAQTCPGWQSWGKAKTDHDGLVYFNIPATLAPGDYQVKMVVRGDQSVADGAIAVWPKGVQAIITDVDGTLTTSDWQAIQDVIFGADAAMYADANTLMNTLAKKDFRIVYVSGRPQVVNRYSRTWLNNHGFPAGTVHLTEDVGQVVPNEAGVQQFKTALLQNLTSTVGVKINHAYGNATTDVGAYEAAGIARANIFIIGPHAGYDGTQALPSYTSRLAKVAALSTVVQP